VGAYAGILSIEDFGARMVYGGRLAYHVNEDFFIEGVYGMSTITDEAFCNNGLCLLPNRVEDLNYFAVSVGYNLFPSEVFIRQKYAMNASVYLLGGIGSTTYVDESHFTANFGLGVRILPKDWLAVHVTIRDFLFESDFLGTTKITNNFELSLGVSAYF
jgi:outer membrane beta-barrel protein